MELTPEKRLDSSPRVVGGDNFSVEDLLDFSNVEKNLENVADDSDHSSPVVESCNSCNTMSDSVSTTEFGNGGVPDTQFSGDLCVPSDDLAELEWLSNFVEEKSFSNEDKEKLQLLSGLAASCLSNPTKIQPDSDFTTNGSFHPDDVVHHASTTTTPNQHPIFDEEVAVPAKARTKRSRAATGNWASMLLQHSSEDQVMTLVSPEGNRPISPNSIKKPSPASPRPKKKKCGSGTNELVRKCLHCDTTTTPQWRSGPLGPKTLCNACGVRYKSGRLVPEYRPASSPTFVLTEHSNSHRKVMELRRRKEMAMMQQSQTNRYHQRLPMSDFIHNEVVLDLPTPNDYLIQQHVRPDFRRLM